MAKIVTKYLTSNPYYNDGRWITGSNFKGFMLHSVGVGQPDPMVFWNSWNRSNYTNAGISGFIGADVTYITAQCMTVKGKVKRMPHGGKSATNNHYIGFEMCEPGTIRYTTGAKFSISDKAAAQAYVKKTYANAVELFAKLCGFHGKDPLAEGVIISHNEGGKKGIATTHVDPEHLWKGLGLPYTMDGFRKDVKAAMGMTITPEKPANILYRVRKTADDVSSQIGAYRSLASAKKLADEHDGYKVFDQDGTMIYNPGGIITYKVKITAEVLNVRAGVGTTHRITTTVKKGEVYTIVEESSGWGRLKSGAGWICLAYTVKV